jgi:hypothetical protein
MPACHIPLNDMQNGFKTKAYEEILVLAFNDISYNSARNNYGNETVKHRCHSAPRYRRSWKLERAAEGFLHNGDSSNDISVIVDFIVIAVESRIGLFLF